MASHVLVLWCGLYFGYFASRVCGKLAQNLSWE
jgi:hypothetical protein